MFVPARYNYSTERSVSKTEELNPPQRRFGIEVLVIFLLTFAVYLPSMRAGLTWDDKEWLAENPLTVAPDGIYGCWTGKQNVDYLPLTSSVFWIQWRMWGTSWAGYHAVNILLHAINTTLLLLLLRKLKIPGAWVAALIFAVHPVNVASVSWITELKNTLSMLFYVLGLLFFLKFDDVRRWGWYALFVVMFVLGLLSKASIVMFPVVLLGCVWWRHRKITLKDFVRIVPLFAISCLFGLVAIYIQHGRDRHTPLGGPENLIERFILMGRATWFYVGKALVPVDLSMVYPRWNLHSTEILAFVPLVLLVVTMVVLWWYRNRWARGLGFGMGYYWVSLLPVLGFVDIAYMGHSFVADHFHYVSIIGVIAVVVSLVCSAAAGRTRAVQRACTVTGMVVVATLSMLTYRRASVFADEITLWTDTLEKNPSASVAYDNRGLAYVSKRQYDQAVRDHSRAIELNPNIAVAYNNRGVAYGLLRKFKTATRDFDKAIELAPWHGPVYNNRGVMHAFTHNYYQAIKDFGKAIELDERYTFARRNGRLAYGRKDGRGLVIKMDHRYVGAYNKLGAEYIRDGEFDKGIRNFDRAIELNPEFAFAYNNRGIAYAQKGDYREAIRNFDKALKLDPTNTGTLRNRAAAVARLRNEQELHSSTE